MDPQTLSWLIGAGCGAVLGGVIVASHAIFAAVTSGVSIAFSAIFGGVASAHALLLCAAS